MNKARDVFLLFDVLYRGRDFKPVEDADGAAQKAAQSIDGTKMERVRIVAKLALCGLKDDEIVARLFLPVRQRDSSWQSNSSRQ